MKKYSTIFVATLLVLYGCIDSTFRRIDSRRAICERDSTKDFGCEVFEAYLAQDILNVTPENLMGDVALNLPKEKGCLVHSFDYLQVEDTLLLHIYINCGLEGTTRFLFYSLKNGKLFRHLENVVDTANGFTLLNNDLYLFGHFQVAKVALTGEVKWKINLVKEYKIFQISDYSITPPYLSITGITVDNYRGSERVDVKINLETGLEI
ncbi:MAG: hypothetical protein KDD99_21080 [Bacteroidetes bacterium]|nr:hypothetical protein [Bacteroidota bacterium]